MTTLSVIVGTFGDQKWIDLAQRALASVDNQTVEPASVHHVHADTLQNARNQGAAMATGEWLLFLDADDELNPKYVEAMLYAIRYEVDTKIALLQPRHRNSKHRVDGAAGKAVMKPFIEPSKGNSLIIGTVVSKELFERVGGFRDLVMYEDWDLWIRCFKEGAKLYQVHHAIYEINVMDNSRNFRDPKTERRIYNQIRKRYFR